MADMNTTPVPLTLQVLQGAVAGAAAAFRCITEYQPAGGPGDKVFPPTYEGGKYATEKRRLPGHAEPVDCVLLDSVQSQANRMELALLEAWERSKDHPEKDKRLPLPVITVQFPSDAALQKVLRITSLEAPHRLADALLRDSLLEGKPFRKSETGERLDDVDLRNATALLELCPTTLIFGMWDSTGPKGGLGAKFQRAMVSEIVGIGVEQGVKTSSRIDPAQIMKSAGPLFQRGPTAPEGIEWTLDTDAAAKDTRGQPIKFNRGGDAKQSKPGDPSKANHSNYPPTIADGGVTIHSAQQTTVLSLPALRRLRFPLKGTPSQPKADDAGRTALAALALCAAALTREQGCDLRSRCLLVPTEPTVWELIDKPLKPGEKGTECALDGKAAVTLLRDAVAAAKAAGLPWMTEELVLTPSPELVALVKKSQDLAAQSGGGDEEGD